MKGTKRSLGSPLKSVKQFAHYTVWYSLGRATPRSYLVELLAGFPCSPPFSDPIRWSSLGCSSVEPGAGFAGTSHHSSPLSGIGRISKKHMVHVKTAKVTGACWGWLHCKEANLTCNLGTEWGNPCARLGSVLPQLLSIHGVISSLTHSRALEVIEKWKIAFFPPAPMWHWPSCPDAFWGFSESPGKGHVPRCAVSLVDHVSLVLAGLQLHKKSI